MFFLTVNEVEIMIYFYGTPFLYSVELKRKMSYSYSE